MRPTTFAPFAVTVVALLLAPAAARAAGPDDSPSAEALFESGRVLLERGAYVEACAKFAESRRLDPQIGVTLYLGECYERAGQTASAWVTFRAAADDAARTNDSRSALAAKRAAALEPHLSRLVVSAGTNAGTAGLVITRDGEEIRNAQWGVAVPVDPGNHHLVATAPGKNPWTHDVSVVGEGSTITVAVPALTDAPRPPPEKKGSSPAPVASPLRTVGIASMGAGAVAIAVGAVFGFLTLDRASELESRCPTYPTCSSRDRDSLVAIDDDARTYGTVSTIGFVAGGALVAVGAVLFFTSPSRVVTTASRGIAIRW